jgi:hypothetical protein
MVALALASMLVLQAIPVSRFRCCNEYAIADAQRVHGQLPCVHQAVLARAA